MNMVHGDGQTKAFQVLCSADGFDLLDQEGSQDRAEDFAVELGPPDEVVVELVWPPKS
jgi:hypothetical protein